MRPEPGEVLHFSEDPNIAVFHPHVAATALDDEALVWAVDAERAPDYWFPRACPRAMAWQVASTTRADRERILGPGGGTRVHVVEHGWIERMLSARVYAYRFDARDFEPFGEPVAHAHVARVTVLPIGAPEPIGNLVQLHASAGIQLRCVPDLRAFWADVTGSSLGFSGIRLRNLSEPLDG